MEKYKDYKFSGIEWFGEIPINWKLIPLKHCVSIKITDGPHETPEFIPTGVPFVSAEAIQNGTINFDSVRGYISEKEDERFSKKCKPHKNDIFIIKSGSTTGKIGYVETDENFNIWSPLALVRSKNEYSSRYLFRFLQSDYFQKQVQTSWSFGTQPNIGMNILENLKIIIPTPEEQPIIAKYLDKKIEQIELIISNKQKLISLYEEEKQAILNQAVTKGLNPSVKFKDSEIKWLGEIPEHWVLKKIGYCSSIVRGGSPRPAGDPRYFCGDYIPWITVKEVTNAVGKFLISTDEYLTEEGSKLSRIIHPETLLLSNSGATLGVPKISKIKGCINDGSVAFTSFEDCLLRDYLYHFFNSHTTIYREEMKGNGQPNLNTEIIKSTPIAIPPIEEQLEIIDYIESKSKQFDTIIEKYNKQIDFAVEYRTTLISEVVTGKIKVPNTIEA